jgi:hypothetical protein
MKIIIDTTQIKKDVINKIKRVKDAGGQAIHSVIAHGENLASLNRRKVVTCPHCSHDHTV